MVLARDERFVFPNGLYKLYKRVASLCRYCVTPAPPATLNHSLTPPFTEPQLQLHPPLVFRLATSPTPTSPPACRRDPITLPPRPHRVHESVCRRNLWGSFSGLRQHVAKPGIVAFTARHLPGTASGMAPARDRPPGSTKSRLAGSKTLLDDIENCPPFPHVECRDIWQILRCRLAVNSER